MLVNRLKFFSKIFPDWLIVDHYSLDKEWETLVRTYAKNIMVIDDLGTVATTVIPFLDQNWFDDKDICHKGLVPSFCTQLLGPRYAQSQS